MRTRSRLHAPWIFAAPLWLLAALGAACGDGAVPGQPPVLSDGGVVVADGGVEPLLEVGTGHESFVPLEDGQPLTIIAGPQGGYHIWAAIRVRAPLVPKGLVTFVRLERDGVALELTERQVSPVKRGAAWEMWALMAMVPDPAAIDGQEVVLAVDVRDTNGLTAKDARRIIAQAP